jgi:hypothetical protein
MYGMLSSAILVLTFIRRVNRHTWGSSVYRLGGNPIPYFIEGVALYYVFVARVSPCWQCLSPADDYERRVKP